MGQSFLFALLPPLGRVLGLGEVQIGLIITSSAVVFFFTSPVWGRLSDSLGRQPVIAIGLAGYGVTMLLFTFVIQLQLWGRIAVGVAYPLLVLSRSGYAAVASAVFPGAQAFIAESTSPSERTAGVALISAAFGTGTILGPGVAGGLTAFGMQAPLYGVALLALAAAALVWRFLAEPERKRPRRDRARLRSTDRRILPYLVIAFVVFLVIGFTQLTGGFYFQDRLALDAADTSQRVGVALMGMAFMSLFAQMVIVRRLRPSADVLIRTGLPIAAAAFVLLLRAESFPGLVLGYVCFGLGIGLANPGFNAAATLAVEPDEQGGLAGLMAATPALSFIVAPVTATALYRLRMQLPYLVCLVLLALLSAGVFLGFGRSSPTGVAGGPDPPAPEH
jgi:MFS family permease